MSKSSKQETLFPVSPVLIVDDERAVLESMSSLLHSAGINNTLCCEDSRQVPGILQERDVEVIVLDLAMPHLSGQELLLLIKARFPHVPVIIVTAMDEVQTAVECMKAGAFEYIVKTAEESKLIIGVKRAVEIRRLKREFSELRTKLLTDRLAHPEAFASILTRSRRMQSVFLFVESIAKSSEPVLITGETGVGKNMIARALHEVSGRTGSYVEVNVAGLDDTMFADTLFGHRRGAFTGAMADREGLIRQARGGTLLLDEIGDLTGQSQIKLLSVLDTRVYYPLGSDVPHRTDARFVIATNRDLNDLIGSERFRKDLYYRLSTHAVHIPPLRERREDLPVL
ncbi:MAG TPA: sigma-54 dependent transcriptional regulator, partial [Spirochaetia bacterium]|nr:sigma-54 dependent transcriptional regulator [Spirochaetia bacterium]